MTREPDPIETQIRSLIGFYCTVCVEAERLRAWLEAVA